MEREEQQYEAKLAVLRAVLLGPAQRPRSLRAQWGNFLQELTSVTRGVSAALLLHDVVHDQHTVCVEWGSDPEMPALYTGDYGQRDVWLKKAGPLVHSGWMGTSEQICPLQDLSRTEYFNDFLSRFGLVHAMWSMVEHTSSRLANIGIYRDSNRKEFGTKELDVMRFLAPHVQRAFRLHFQLASLKKRDESLQEPLDLLPIGIILLGPKGEIAAMNQAGATIVAENDGLLATRSGLRATRAVESATLERLTACAEAISAGKGLNPAGAMLISRKIRPPLQVLITPGRSLPFDVPNPVTAIVIVNDPARHVHPPQEILQSLFGLTPAETRLALLVGDGYALREIGEMIGVSSNTLKTQLASIFRKTGTSRQAGGASNVAACHSSRKQQFVSLAAI